MRLNTCFPNLEGKGGRSWFSGGMAPLPATQAPSVRPGVPWWLPAREARGPGMSEQATQLRPWQHQAPASNNILQICMTACRLCDCFPAIEEFLKMKQKGSTQGWLIWGLSAGLLPSLPRSGFQRWEEHGDCEWLMETQPQACPVHAFYLFILSATSTLHLLITQTTFW